MAKTINSDLIRGNINTIILKALYDGDRYGYDIIKEIELKSHGQYILKQPTLYSCLKRLENQGFIEAYWGEQTSNGGRRKYYRLTEAGKEIFKQSQDEYEYSRTVIDKLISDNQYDLSSLTPLVNTESDDETEDLSEKDAPKTLISEPQQLSMDVSELEVATHTESETEEVIIEETVEVEDSVCDSKIIETVNEYVQPAPVFAEVESNDANNKIENNVEAIKNESTAKLSENADTNYEIPKINNTEYINSLLNQNTGSYFYRTDDNIEIKNNNNSINTVQTSNDVDDDIEKRLEALRASYHQEIEQSDENSNQTTYQPQNVFATQKSNNTTPPLSFSANEKAENYENGFFRYNVQHSGITDQQKEEPITYRSLASLIKEEPSKPQTQPIIPNPKPVSIKEQIKIRNFGKLSESIEELGENVKLRPHYDTKHDYKKQYYYRDSYLRLFHFGIMFLMMLMEVFMIYIIGKRAIGANTSYDIPFYIISIIACFLLPVFAGAIYIYRPNSKKRNDFNLKSSMIFRLVVTIQLILIVYALNIWMGMPITFDGKYFVTLALPLIFAINFPVSALIFNILRKKEKFALKE